MKLILRVWIANCWFCIIFFFICCFILWIFSLNRCLINYYRNICAAIFDFHWNIRTVFIFFCCVEIVAYCFAVLSRSPHFIHVPFDWSFFELMYDGWNLLMLLLVVVGFFIKFIPFIQSCIDWITVQGVFKYTIYGRLNSLGIIARTETIIGWWWWARYWTWIAGYTVTWSTGRLHIYDLFVSKLEFVLKFDTNGLNNFCILFLFFQFNPLRYKNEENESKCFKHSEIENEIPIKNIEFVKIKPSHIHIIWYAERNLRKL